MKRNILYALFLGLMITACNDADLTTPGGQETESADIFIPEDAAEGELLGNKLHEQFALCSIFRDEDIGRFGLLTTRCGQVCIVTSCDHQP